MPLNGWLPEHEGMITTRGLQEWACLLPQELPFSTAQRLLGWVAKESAVISQTQLRTLVRQHGGEIRQAEAAEVSELSVSELSAGVDLSLSEKTPNLVPLDTPRRHPAWPVELHGAVEQALSEESITPPEGVSQNDWDRVIAYQKQARDEKDAKDEVEMSDLARLGPKVDDNQVVASVDGIQVRRQQKRRFHELRTAKVVTSTYEAEPEEAFIFRTPEMGYREEDTHLWTEGETRYARHWFPCFDYPNERFTSEVICHVPEEMVVISNGKLISEEKDAKTGLKAVRWLQDKPHVSYLIALVAGKLKKIEDRYRDIPLAFYTLTSQIAQAENSFRDTADMMAFFEQEIGVPYPWDKYYQAAVDRGGGMENTSLTILTDGTLFTDETENIRSSQGLVAHELAHQWFGDYVTCKDWSHLWLNEGFATYYALLYDGHKNGRDSMRYGLYQRGGWILGAKDAPLPIVDRTYDTAEEQFGYRAYQKGGWVLHMLRTQLGEDLYRQCIRTYLERNAFQSVVTEDLNTVVEEISGRSFDQFFDQWVYHARYPELEVSYNWKEGDKLAKVTVKQTQKLSDKVLLFNFPTKIRFTTETDVIDREIIVKEKQHDFYFPLEEAPNIVRFDPGYGLLAKVNFDKPNEMLYAQLEDKEDVIGRLLAVKALKSKEDKKTIEKLKIALNEDPFYGIRIEASIALGEIHTNEAFEALVASIDQLDARVRRRVVEDLSKFYREESLAESKKVLNSEKNPDILAVAIRNLGKYHDDGIREIILEFLQSQSYRNLLAHAAIQAIRSLDDPTYTDPLREILLEREKEFRSGVFGRALGTLAYIARNEENKDGVREFLAGHVNHKNRRIQTDAISALGTLRDTKAISLVETFTGVSTNDQFRRAAEQALNSLRDAKKVPVELKDLRSEVLELKKENEEIKEELEDLKKRLDAKEQEPSQEEERKPQDDVQRDP